MVMPILLIAAAIGMAVLFARAVRRALADIRLRRDLSALKRAGQADVARQRLLAIGYGPLQADQIIKEL
jgi:heme oxygenase